VSFGLGVKHYIYNDSPHALAVAKLSVPICDRLFCPWIIPYKAWLYLGINREKITRYRAIDPVVWVKREMEKIKECRGWSTTRSKKNKKNQFTILIRPEEAKASYITDNKNLKNSLALIDSIVKNFSLYSHVLILGRYQDQIDFFKQRYENKVQILENVVDGISLLRKIDLFIGAGGTMSAEAALLGKPVISIAPISFYVENFLIRCGFVKKIRNEKELTRYSHNIFSKIKNEKKDFKNNDILKKYKVSGFQKRLFEKSLKFIDSMEDPIVQFKKFI
jgi:predicted glycosyltransferase